MARVLIPIAPGYEDLEAVTLIDLLRRAEIEVVVAGIVDGPIKGSRGTVLVPDAALDDVMGDDFDMIALPGGQPGTDNLDRDTRVHRLLQRMAEQGKYTAAICAAPRVLANAGLLDGRRATSYPGFIDADALPSTEVVSDAVVIDDRVVTSRGPGTAMDFALELIAQLAGRTRRDTVEAALQRPEGAGG